MVVDIDDIETGARRPGSRPVLRLVGRDPVSSNDNSAVESTDGADGAVPDEAGSDGHPRLDRSPRRRGPLITRWIGFAARRQRAQERTDRLARECDAQRSCGRPSR